MDHTEGTHTTHYHTLLLCEWPLWTGEHTLLNVHTIWFMWHNIYYMRQFWSNTLKLLPRLSKHAVGGDLDNWWTVLDVGDRGREQKVWTSPTHQKTSNSSPHGCEWLSACTTLNISFSSMTKITSRLILMLNALHLEKINPINFWNSFLHKLFECLEIDMSKHANNWTVIHFFICKALEHTAQGVLKHFPQRQS